MPHSLRAKLKYLTICGHIRKKDYERLCKALDNEGVLDKIKAEIEQMNNLDYVEPITVDEVLKIIDKYKADKEKEPQPKMGRCKDCR